MPTQILHARQCYVPRGDIWILESCFNTNLGKDNIECWRNFEKLWDIIFHSCTVHLDTIKVFYLPADVQEDCFKRILKFTLKQLLHIFDVILTVHRR